MFNLIKLNLKKNLYYQTSKQASMYFPVISSNAIIVTAITFINLFLITTCTLVTCMLPIFFKNGPNYISAPSFLQFSLSFFHFKSFLFYRVFFSRKLNTFFQCLFIKFLSISLLISIINCWLRWIMIIHNSFFLFFISFLQHCLCGIL